MASSAGPAEGSFDDIGLYKHTISSGRSWVLYAVGYGSSEQYTDVVVGGMFFFYGKGIEPELAGYRQR